MLFCEDDFGVEWEKRGKAPQRRQAVTEPTALARPAQQVVWPSPPSSA